MSSSPLMVGLDVGTTNIKALIFDPFGHEIARSQAKTPTHYPQPEWAYYDPAELWQTVVRVLKQAIFQIDEPANIISISTASIAETGIPIDAHGTPTYHAIAWFDQRTRPQYEKLQQIFDRDQIFARTGLSLQPIFSLCKILWLRENHPNAFLRTKTWLNTADYIAFQLSGVPATDYSLASRTLAFDIHKRQWATDLLGELNISPDFFATVCPSGTSLGSILPHVAHLTGLPPHTQICTGGHDHICGALAVGVTDPGTLLNSLGTAEALCMPISQPLSDPSIGQQNFTMGAHVVPDQNYFLGGLYTSGACIEWFRNLFGQNTEYATLIREAEKTPPGSLGVNFLPHLRYTNPPHEEAIARGAFTGLNSDVDRGTLFRALLEGLAFEARQVFEASQSHTGVPKIERIVAIGGGIRNQLLMQIKATILNQPIFLTETDEATALGAAILAGLGAGIYPNVSAALEMVETSERMISPIPDQIEHYDAIYSRIHKEIYPSLQALHSETDQIHTQTRSE